MWVQEQERKGGRLLPVEGGPTVRLLEQTGDHKVRFAGVDGDAQEMDAGEFFTLHREADRDEIRDFHRDEKAARAAAKAGGKAEHADT